jgi:hypothetical protein
MRNALPSGGGLGASSGLIGVKLKTLKSSVQQLGSQLATAPSVFWRADEGSSTKRGYKWQQARAGYLAKHPLCAYCEQAGGNLSPDEQIIGIEPSLSFALPGSVEHLGDGRRH